MKAPALILQHPKSAVRFVEPAPPESVVLAKQFQKAERLRALRLMGIPGDLLDLYQSFTLDEMAGWTALIARRLTD